MAKTKTSAIKPLSHEENMAWAEHKQTIPECLEAGLDLGRALLDVRKRKLYRVEYETNSWSEFIEKCPWFRHSRQRSYQLMDYANDLEQLSTVVDTSGLTEWENRALRAIVAMHDRAEVHNRLRTDNRTIDTKNVEEYYRKLLAEKEAKHKEDIVLGVVSSEDDEDDEEAEEEEAVAAADNQSENEAALERIAETKAKPRIYDVRFIEYARLAERNVRKVTDRDLATEDRRLALEAALDRMEAVCAEKRAQIKRVRDGRGTKSA